MQRCNASVNFSPDGKPFFPVTANDRDLHEHFQKIARDMVGVENMKDFQPVMGAEDFSFFAEAIPGYFYYIGMLNETEGPLASGHSPYFRVNEAALPYGAALHASLAATYLIERRSSLLETLKKSSHDEL